MRTNGRYIEIIKETLRSFHDEGDGCDQFKTRQQISMKLNNDVEVRPSAGSHISSIILSISRWISIAL